MKELQKVPSSLQDLQKSYDSLYKGWMATHNNIQQTKKILEILRVKKGDRLLDIGCGLGYLVNMARTEGSLSFGIDISLVALKKAKEHYSLNSFVLGMAEFLPFPKGSFDFVVILGSLEHFLIPAISVKEVSRVLKKNGKVAILVPNSHHIRAIYNVYKYGEILPEDQDFERFATRKEWENLFISNGLRVIQVHKFDTGMARKHKKGRELFWYLYNILFRFFGDSWIPLNLTYTFIFICEREE